MIKYTTPAVPMELEGIDLTSQYNVYVTIEQGDIKITKRESDLIITVTVVDDVPTTSITLLLTQEETGKLDYDKSAKIQINWINQAGVRDASTIGAVSVFRNLLDEVIEYEAEA